MFLTYLICKCDHEGCQSELVVKVPVKLLRRTGPQPLTIAAGPITLEHVFELDHTALSAALDAASWHRHLEEDGRAPTLCPQHVCAGPIHAYPVDTQGAEK